MEHVSPALELIGIGISGALFILLLVILRGISRETEWQTAYDESQRRRQIGEQAERSARIRSFREKAAKGIDWRGGNDAA